MGDFDASAKYKRNIIHVCLFGLVFFFFGVYHLTREFFTHMETSPLPVKGCKFRLMLDTYGHLTVKVL